MWGENLENGSTDWRTSDRTPKIDKKTSQIKINPRSGAPEYEDVPNDLFAFQTAACAVPSQKYADAARKNIPREEDGLKPWELLTESLLKRQNSIAADLLGANVFTVAALSIAPFATGLGNEHPLENGFAFLNPYGLPYLPGSGVKGVLRRAAEELRDGVFGVSNQDGWTDAALQALFGVQDGEGDPRRGALSFWDVIPQLKGDHLQVEVMTPHQSHYLQGSESPHDSGSPNPICFLSVPPESQFTFYVQCDIGFLERLAPDLAADHRWKALLRAAFAHAFDWLGFGAKTAVGYGAMWQDPEAEARLEAAARQAAQAAETARLEAERLAAKAAMTPNLRAVEEFTDIAEKRLAELRNGKERPNEMLHNRARQLAKMALEGADWTAPEKLAAANAIEEWLPKLVDRIDMKDERRKLKLPQLKSPA